jgi:hypothetical protein
MYLKKLKLAIGELILKQAAENLTNKLTKLGEQLSTFQKYLKIRPFHPS